MTIRVRFESGLVVQYNSATYVQWGSQAFPVHCLYTREGGAIVAGVPLSCVVEFVTPCQIEKPHETENPTRAATLLARDPRAVETWNGGGRALALLKRQLRGFDARARSWR